MTAIDRRTFLQASGTAALAAAVPDRILRDPYAPLGAHRATDVVRVRGRVRAAGRGLAGVVVSDGVSVATTDRDGAYTLLADRGQPFVWVSVPAGYAIPASATGTAAFHQPVAADGDEMTAVFDLAPLDGDDDAHAFLLLADTQTQNRFETGRLHDETVPDVVATVRGLDVPVFGVACGDIMYDDLSLYPEYERAVSRMGVPFWQVVGNHDLVQDAASDRGSTRVFERHFGPNYYSFDRGQVHYVVLDDVLWHGRGYIGYVNDRQLAWLRADLARIEAGRTVVVFLHIPALSTGADRNGASPGFSASVNNREALYRILEPYESFLISGHTHEHERHRDGGPRHHVTGTVCGAWWSGDICWDGTPNGYAVYEVRGSEVRWRYKATRQPVTHQIRAYPAGSDREAPDDVVANVWDADDDWTVVWYEHGERRGQMRRRTGHDPRSVAEHTGSDRPPRREWVEPTRTAHLFSAPAGTGPDIVVEATDAWGRVYTARVPTSRTDR